MEVTTLAEMLGAPVLTSAQGKGMIPDDHPLSLGTSWRLEAVDDTYSNILKRADAVLAIGTTFGAMNTAGRRLPVPQNLIRLDIDPRELNSNYPARLRLCGDAKALLARLIAELRAQGTSASAW